MAWITATHFGILCLEKFQGSKWHKSDSLDKHNECVTQRRVPRERCYHGNLKSGMALFYIGSSYNSKPVCRHVSTLSDYTHYRNVMDNWFSLFCLRGRKRFLWQLRSLCLGHDVFFFVVVGFFFFFQASTGLLFQLCTLTWHVCLLSGFFCLEMWWN